MDGANHRTHHGCWLHAALHPCTVHELVSSLLPRAMMAACSCTTLTASTSAVSHRRPGRLLVAHRRCPVPEYVGDERERQLHPPPLLYDQHLLPFP